jgi:hypothetical protein
MKKTESPVLKAALGLRKKFGWKLFPARMEGGKKWSWLSAEFAPGGENWGMTADPAQLRKNFSNRRWRDQCGIGIPTGAVNKIFVIEADTVRGHSVDGLAALRQLEREHGKLPKTLMAVSPSGSVHRYYRYPDNGMKITSATLVHGVDIKASGGMVIGPPSRRSDGAYRWKNSLPIVKAPRWLLEQVQEEERAHSEPNVFERYGNRVNMSELTLAVAMIPNDDISWDPDKRTGNPGWNAIGMAIYDAGCGSAEGFRLFDAFSRRSKKYNSKRTHDKWWKGFRKCPPRKITAGSIFFLAEQAVPDYRDRCIARDPKVIALIEEFHKLMDAS